SGAAAIRVPDIQGDVDGRARTVHASLKRFNDTPAGGGRTALEMQDPTTTTTKRRATGAARDVNVDLIAVVVAATEGVPSVLTIGQGDALPSGPFELGHRS